MIDKIFLEGALTASAQFLLVFEVFDHEADRVPSESCENIFHGMDGIHQSGLCLSTWLGDLFQMYSLDWATTKIALSSFRRYKCLEYLEDANCTVGLHAEVLIRKVEGTASTTGLDPARDVLGTILFIKDCVNNLRKIEALYLGYA